MVILKRDGPRSYQLYDEAGRVVGRIELPRGEALLGRTAGTVFLRRDRPPSRTPRLLPSRSRAA